MVLHKGRGFTLIELLIAMVIVGILVAVVLPSYTTYVQRSRRTDAMSTLAQNQMILERCYSQSFSYSATCAGLPTFPSASSQGFYTISLSNLTASTYTLTATARGAQAQDTTCASMTINQANVQTAASSTGTSQSTCWAR